MAAKRPKKPKQSAGLKTWENYDKKVTKWEHDRKKLDRLRNKYS